MCPACLTSAALVLAGAASAGGLAALSVRRLRLRSGAEVHVTIRTGRVRARDRDGSDPLAGAPAPGLGRPSPGRAECGDLSW